MVCACCLNYPGEDVGVVQAALHVVKSLDQLGAGVFLPTFAKVGEKLLLHMNLGLNLEVFQEVLELGHEADAHVLNVVRNDESSRSMVYVPLVGNEVVAGAGQFFCTFVSFVLFTFFGFFCIFIIFLRFLNFCTVVLLYFCTLSL